MNLLYYLFCLLNFLLVEQVILGVYNFMGYIKVPNNFILQSLVLILIVVIFDVFFLVYYSGKI